MQTRLPDDHYRYIVCHVQDRKDLLSLRLTSRALGYEAAKVLYRIVEIKAFTQSVCPLLSCLSENRRTAALVERFSITGVPFWRDSQCTKLIRGFLRKAYNLKELCILSAGIAITDITLGELTEGIKFSLRLLRCNLPVGESCNRFFQSQPGIVDLCWLSDSGPTAVTHSHLPNLTTLENTNNKFLMALLRGSKVERLKYSRLEGPLRGTFHTIEVLYMARWLSRGDLFQSFPNLRYLSASFYKLSDVPYTIRDLSKLEKLVINTYPIRNQDTDFATELYSTHPALRYIDLSHGQWCYKFDRGADSMQDLSLDEHPAVDEDEWKSWW